MIRVAINGFGRIGRSAFKIAFANSELEIVAINDLSDTKTLAYLLKHDSNYGTYHKEVSSTDDSIVVDGKKIAILAEKDPSLLPWGKLNIDVVIESTGFFTKVEDASLHIKAGAKRVVVSAAIKNDENNPKAGNFLMGVNADDLTNQEIISNQSCTTNCITPIAFIMEHEFGIAKSMMTTVHAYTTSQSLQDSPSKDLREGRNAAENIVPTTTNATVAATKIIPSLKGNFLGLSIRVPVPVVSLSDFTILTKKDTTVEEVNAAIKNASESSQMKHILACTSEELVSSDFIGDPHSATVDLNLTQVVGGNLVKVVAWYDNEWGYSNRLVEMVEKAGKTTK